MFYEIGKDDKKDFRLIIENFKKKISYKSKTELAQTLFLDDNHLKILITYNYKTFTSGRTNNNKRKLTRVDIPSYYLGIKDWYLDYH